MAADPNPEEEAWCAARAAEVAPSVARLAPGHGRIGEWPAWHVMPYASIWAVEQGDRPEWLGWWAIAGDLPTDVIAAHELATPREAMRAFAKRWLLHGAALDRGEIPPAWAHLPHEALPKLAAQLKKRAASLLLWADDEASWPVHEE